MTSIENEYLKITVNELGGSLTSIIDKKTNEELLYQPDSRSWSGQDVVIFPVVAALKDQYYTHNGNKYYFKNHGLIRYEMLTPSIHGNTLTMRKVSNEETKKLYPFDFIFEVKYILDRNKLTIEYNVKNTDKDSIYFSVGGHPALKASGNFYQDRFEFENTKVFFGRDVNTIKYNLNDDGSLITGTSNVVIPSCLELTKDVITKEKTLIYDASNINSVILYTNNHKFKFDINDSKILALWTMPGFGDYICVEPWWGLPDCINPNREISQKPLIEKLESNETYQKYFSITVE